MKFAIGLGLGVILCAATALAAGPFDGSWQGEVSPVSMGRGTGCPSVAVKITITNGSLSGHYLDGMHSFPIKGTVQPDGTLAQAFIGHNPMTGKITGSELVANLVSIACEGKQRQMTLHRAG